MADMARVLWLPLLSKELLEILITTVTGGLRARWSTLKHGIVAVDERSMKLWQPYFLLRSHSRS